MSVRVMLPPTFRDVLADSPRALAGMWVCSASPLVAEICAGSGLDWLLIDAEHTPQDLPTIVAQLQAVAAYPIVPVVRPPSQDPVLLKQYLDLGAQNLLIPMVDTAEQAAAVVSAVRYPGRGIRGVGSALSRGARWNRVPDYLARAEETISVWVQIESAEAVANVEAILAVDGIDGIFIGPSDLAASMGLLGQQEHPDVIEAVDRCIAAALAAGKPAGVNAFSPGTAQHYVEVGVRYLLVGADVAMLARGSEALADRFVVGTSQETDRASY